jgi:hypothetical protein
MDNLALHLFVYSYVTQPQVVTDFTALIQERNAFDLGGLYFSANLLLSQTSVIVCALLYHLHYEDDIAEGAEVTMPYNATSINGTATKFTAEQLETGVGILFTIFLISFSLFMLKIERKYLWTFFSTETGHGKAKRLFRTGKNDFEKAQIFTNNNRQWTSIRGEVAEWLDANWDRWERDNPDWFDVVFIDSVDDDIMPVRVLVRLKQEAEGGERRRSSFMERVSARAEEPEGGADE